MLWLLLNSNSNFSFFPSLCAKIKSQNSLTWQTCTFKCIHFKQIWSWTKYVGSVLESEDDQLSLDQKDCKVIILGLDLPCYDNNYYNIFQVFLGLVIAIIVNTLIGNISNYITKKYWNMMFNDFFEKLKTKQAVKLHFSFTQILLIFPVLSHVNIIYIIYISHTYQEYCNNVEIVQINVARIPLDVPDKHSVILDHGTNRRWYYMSKK